VAVVIVAVAVPAIMIAVPMMIVTHPAAFTLPVTLEEAFAIMMRYHPDCAGIGRACPVTLMPLVMVPDRMPVANNPHKIRAGARRLNPYDTRRRRSADADTDGDIGSECAPSEDN